VRRKITFIILLAICASGFAQTKIVGKIVNEQNEDVGFAHVYNRTNGMGKVSDMFGRFELIATKGDTVQFSFVGYQTMNTIINVAHIAHFMKVVLPEDSLLLPSITIYADSQLKVPLNYQGEAIFITGVSRDNEMTPTLPGKITKGTSPGIGGIPGGGVTINGPLTYFSRDEKEKREVAVVEETSKRTFTYNEFVAEDSTRLKLMAIYQIDSAQYSRIIVRLNRQNPGIQRASSREEVWHWIIRFFDETVPVIKIYDMH
jgi:hypothetical protein